jgi:hypothetical protein
LGREYPAGYTNFFRPKLKAAFMKKRDLDNEDEIRKSVAFGNYIVKGENRAKDRSFGSVLSFSWPFLILE